MRGVTHIYIYIHQESQRGGVWSVSEWIIGTPNRIAPRLVTAGLWGFGRKMLNPSAGAARLSEYVLDLICMKPTSLADHCDFTLRSSSFQRGFRLRLLLKVLLPTVVFGWDGGP